MQYCALFNLHLAAHSLKLALHTCRSALLLLPHLYYFMSADNKDKAEIAFAGSVEPDQINICVREQGKAIEIPIVFPILHSVFLLVTHLAQ